MAKKRACQLGCKGASLVDPVSTSERTGMNLLLFVFLAAIASAAPADLFTPVKHNNLAAIRKAVQSGADVNARDENGATALMYAAVYSTPESMRLLIKSGADVN